MRTQVNRIGIAIKMLSIDMLIVLAAFLGCCILVIQVVKQIFLENKTAWDFKVFHFFESFVSDTTTSVMKFFTIFGSHLFLVPANLILIGYSLFVKRDSWFAIKTAAVSTSSLILMFTLKSLFNRQRPLIPLLEQVPGLSFPSGHAFMSFSFFGLLIYIVNKKVRNRIAKYSLILLLLVFIILIGISRIYLRVHFATDVIAGLSLGMMWLVISLSILHLIDRRNIKRKARPLTLDRI